MAIEEKQLVAWINGEHPFEQPPSTWIGAVQSRIRLIYQQWSSKHGVAGSNCLPMAPETFSTMVKTLDLPPCYLYDFASRECVPLRVKQNVTHQSVSRYRTRFMSYQRPLTFVVQASSGKVHLYGMLSCPWR